ncbi:MAG: tripartite tricarboxylate transporter substrate binding protein [Betaproteobacteria bacterium]|jgi:tripartite-type tricarboxylate transporter receptor subunit TctC
MNIIRRGFGTLILTLWVCAAALAQDYPNKPVRIVVPYPPGGATDILARQLSTRLGEQLGQSIVIDNRPGAGGGIGTAIVAKAAPDGYTIVFGNLGPNAINSSIYPNLSYDAEKDFAPICVVVNTPLILVVRPQSGIKTLGELIALGKAQPGKLFYGSVGIGAASHVASELFNIVAGTKFMHVPYKGSAPASLGAIAGEVTMYFGTGPEMTTHIKSGVLRALAISTSSRSPAMPDLQTVAEAGLPGFAVDVWFGLLAPAGTPRPIVDKVNRAVGAVLQNPEMRTRLIEMNAVPAFNSPDEFSAQIKADIVKWGKVVREANIKPE